MKLTTALKESAKVWIFASIASVRCDGDGDGLGRDLGQVDGHPRHGVVDRVRVGL